MLFRLTIFFLLLNLVYSDRWVRKTFWDFPYSVRNVENPCRSHIVLYEGYMESDVRNDSSSFRCLMWSMTGTMLGYVERMLTSLPLEEDFCRDFNYESQRSVEDLQIPVEFNYETMNVLYEVT